MIELAHTIVAEITVSRLRGSENQTSLTEFHRSESCVTKVRTVGGFALLDEVKYSLALVMDVDILGVYFVASVL